MRRYNWLVAIIGAVAAGCIAPTSYSTCGGLSKMVVLLFFRFIIIMDASSSDTIASLSKPVWLGRRLEASAMLSLVVASLPISHLIDI